MNGDLQHRLKELSRILSDLAVPHPPLERFKLGSRLWRLVAGLSRDEQKQLLREFGLQEAAHLEQLADGRTGAMPATFLEFIERGTKTLTPERISTVLGALTAVERPGPPVSYPPEAPLEIVDEDGVHTHGRVRDVASAAPPDTSTIVETESDRKRAGTGVAVDKPIVEVETAGSPSRSAVPTPTVSLRELEVEPETAEAARAVAPDERKEEKPSPDSAPSVEPELPSASSRVQCLTERCARLDSNWKRRRFWLDVVRQGPGIQDVDALLRAVSECGLPSQDYVWVVDEMVVRGILPEELFPTAVELAPSEGGARLLQRRFLTLAGSWAAESRARSERP